MTYESVVVRDSETVPGVKLTLAKMSFGRRMDLLREFRQLTKKAEFLAASEKPEDKMDAVLAQLEMDRVYVRWGLREVTGMEIDGEPATPESVASEGPEGLFREVLAAIKAECGLAEAERKN